MKPILLCLVVALVGCKNPDPHVRVVENPTVTPELGTYHCLNAKEPPRARCAELVTKYVAELSAKDKPDYLFCVWALVAARRFGPVNMGALEAKCCDLDRVRMVCGGDGKSLCDGAHCSMVWQSL